MDGIEIGDVVQFNENHKWTGCLGIVTQKKVYDDGKIRMMVGVPIPQEGTAYIFVMNDEIAIEKIGKSNFMVKSDEEED